MATKPMKFCDKCQRSEPEVGPILKLFAKVKDEWCYQCSAGHLQTAFGATQVQVQPHVQAVNGIAPPSDGLTDKERARSKRREELQAEHGTVVYVVKRDDDVTAGQQVQQRTGDLTKTIEIIEGVVGEKGNWFAKIVI
jgi:hypothetical protein